MNWTDRTTNWCLGLVTGAPGRVRSDGMLLPIGLHSFSIALALLGDEVLTHVRG
jgi:hypothetical protein